jgi:quinoprotein glucose dehydrogenase
VQLALASPVASLRLAALPIATRLHPANAMTVLTALLNQGTPPEQRAALTTLGAMPDPAADTILAGQLRKLAAGLAPAAIQVELIDAAARRSDPAVKQLLAERDESLAKNPDPLAPFRLALEGGDPRKGARLFYRHPVLACVRCHSAGDDGGGEAGPRLLGIGALKPREYILESIVKPNAKIAEGFDTTVVTRKSGGMVAGNLVTEDATQISLRNSDGKVIAVPKADIAERATGPSPMPEIFGAILTKAELRDLVAFVASLTTMPVHEEKSGPRALMPPPTD